MSRADAMRRPDDLTGAGAEMWDRCAPELVRMGTLTDETRDRFAKACRAHCEFVRLVVQGGPPNRIAAASRLMMRHSRGFGTTPMDRVRLYEAGKIGREWLPWLVGYERR
jgi:hypothetical protein